MARELVARHDRATTDDAGGKAAEQLAAIESLDQALRAAGLDYWLFGGWGSTLGGRITRDHADIDAAAWRRDYDEIRAALLAAGWRHTPLETDVVGTRYRWREQRTGAHVCRGSRRDGRRPDPEHEVVWTAEPFGVHERSLLGVRARVIPLELLRDGKRRPREGFAERAFSHSMSSTAGLQVREHREHAAVILRRLPQPSFVKMLAMCFSTAPTLR